MTSVRRIEKWLLERPTTEHPAILLPRLMAGGVFVSEGVMKFVFPSLGVGRFAALGFPLPSATASFVAGLEIVGGALLIAGLFTRLVAIPFNRPRRPSWASGRCCTSHARTTRSS